MVTQLRNGGLAGLVGWFGLVGYRVLLLWWRIDPSAGNDRQKKADSFAVLR